MEVIKPMDFSSFSAFCEHLNKSSQIAATTATTIPPTINNGKGIYLEVKAKNTNISMRNCKHGHDASPN